MRWKTVAILSMIALICVVWFTSQRGATADTPRMEAQLNLEDMDAAKQELLLNWWWGHGIAGTYYGVGDFFGAPVEMLYTFHTDGTYIASSNADMGGGTLFGYGNPHGNWRRTGRRTIEAVDVGFGFDLGVGWCSGNANGEWPGFLFGMHCSTPKFSLTVDFAPDYQSAMVDGRVDVYGPGQNPTDPDAVPNNTWYWDAPFEVTRINFD